MPVELDGANGLVIPEGGPGNRMRFAECFREVWAKIPDEYRTRILDYWRKFRGAPSIDLISRYKLPGENIDYGCGIRFNAEVADWASDEMLRNLIAHELAHVWHYATPNCESSEKAFKIRIDELNAIKEREADELGAAWGFDMKGLRDWGNENLGKFREFGCIFLKGAKY